MNANQALSQLSYSPIIRSVVVGLGRFELPTSPLSGVRSNQLSYRPMFLTKLLTEHEVADLTLLLTNGGVRSNQLSYRPMSH